MQALGQAQRANSARWCIVMDYPNHYRDHFFEELSKRIDVRLLLTSREGADRRGLLHLFPEGMNVTYLGNWSYEAVTGSIWLSCLVCARALIEVFRAKPDVLIVHGYRNPACWMAPFVSRVLGCSRVIWGESNYFDKKRKAWLELLKRLFVSLHDQAHTYGRNGRDYFVFLGMRPDRVLVTQPTVLERKFMKVQKLSRTGLSRIRLLYVGRFTAVKNLHYLLSAMAQLRGDSAETCPVLTMVGFGSEENALREYCTQSGLLDNVVWLGRQQQDEVAQIMAGQDALVLPSLIESYGLVVLEAMFAGLPVIVSTRCGCTDDLVYEDCGWRIDPTRRESLVAVLKQLMTIGPEGASLLGHNARRRALSFSSLRSAELTISAVAALVRRRKAANS